MLYHTHSRFDIFCCKIDANDSTKLVLLCKNIDGQSELRWRKRHLVVTLLPFFLPGMAIVCFICLPWAFDAVLSGDSSCSLPVCNSMGYIIATIYAEILLAGGHADTRVRKRKQDVVIGPVACDFRIPAERVWYTHCSRPFLSMRRGGNARLV